MRPFAILLLVFGFAVAPFAKAQDAAKTNEARKDTGKQEDDLAGWKWANFAILAAFLAYVAVKFGNPYFNGQTAAISKELDEARRRRAEADQRSAEVDRKLANLGADIDSLRASILEAQNAQLERMRRQGDVETERIRSSAEQQIDTVSKHARLDLQRQASKLALDLAEQRLRSRMSPDLQNSLAAQFVEDLKA